MGAGYNLVTGLGSPDMPDLVAALIGPVIARQPQSQTMTSGSDVTFAVNAAVPGTSGSLSYQWQFQGSDLADGTANGLTVSGSQGPQLLLMGAGSAAAGDYVCVVTFTPANPSGLPVAISTNPASLTLVAADPGLATSISTRAFVGTGDNILIGGFYIVGSTARTVLIQGLGPALGQLGVAGFLAHPALSIHQYQSGQDVTLYSNTGWGSSQVLLDAAASVFATPVLSSGSADSELLLTLPPGGYSAEVGGADGGTGVALCAIYELP
jgi:hypothetical protein